MAARIVVLASGSGTLLQALLDVGFLDPDLMVCAVISDRADAVALDRARTAGVPAEVVAPQSDRALWNRQLTAAIAAHKPDWIVCAGFMRILDGVTVERFAGRIVNSHPALLPAFAGAHGVADALAYGVRVSGCTIHLVDAGAQEAVGVFAEDTESSLHERIKEVERRLLLTVIRDLARMGCTVTGRKVSIP